MTIVYIRWKDACTQEAAEPHTPADPMLADLREVGFLVGETDEAVCLATEMDENGKPGRWRLHIPKVNIIEERRTTFDRAFPLKKRPSRK